MAILKSNLRVNIIWDTPSIGSKSVPWSNKVIIIAYDYFILCTSKVDLLDCDKNKRLIILTINQASTKRKT